jgi:hypothetical protein
MIEGSPSCKRLRSKYIQPKRLRVNQNCQRRSKNRPVWRSKSRPLTFWQMQSKGPRSGPFAFWPFCSVSFRRLWPGFAPPRRQSGGDWLTV